MPAPTIQANDPALVEFLEAGVVVGSCTHIRFSHSIVCDACLILSLVPMQFLGLALRFCLFAHEECLG